MSRCVSLVFLCLVATPLFAGGPRCAAEKAAIDAKAAKDADRLVVHEWGTFTSISGASGAALEWRPLGGKDDLPKFVYSKVSGEGRAQVGHGLRSVRCAEKGKCNHKSCVVGTVRMETPVIYFYSKRKREVRAAVGFPEGKITEWYPHAREVGSGVDWGRIVLDPGAKVTLPREPGESHYYPAREVDAVPLRVCGITPEGRRRVEHERFLFYRGVGTFPLPLSARFRKNGDLEVANFGKQALGTMIVFERAGGRIGVRVVKTGPKGLVSRHTQRLPRPLEGGEGSYVCSIGRGTHYVQDKLRGLLEAEGLYPKEARAMIKTWSDHWFEEGLRVFYLVPRARTDELLPLTLEPTPDELVRVLVGRLEMITPALRLRVKALVAGLTSEDTKVRQAATKALAREGRFAEPVLIELAAELSPAQRALLAPYLPAPNKEAAEKVATKPAHTR